MTNYRIKIAVILVIMTVSSFIFGAFFSDNISKKLFKSKNTTQPEVVEKPLEKYEIQNLSGKKIANGELEIGEIIEKTETYESRLFSYRFDSDLDEKLDKKTTGVVNFPTDPGTYPLVVMFRGYVDQTIYKSGMGTKNAAAYFSKNNFVTISLDFLGYAGSDEESGNIFESRFQTYVTAYSIINYLENNPKLKVDSSTWTLDNIFLWGHSNGGQIALTVLEISQNNYPTALWAPVSKSFPYSILYYTDESEDRGKLIRSELGKFEELYDVEKYSLTNYLDMIKAPIQIHQGIKDDAVPREWTDTLVKELKKYNAEINYFIYPGADHNLQPDWNSVIERDLDFFNKNLLN